MGITSLRSPPEGGAPTNRRLAGIALMCGTLAFFACLDASAKTLAGLGVDPLLSTFMRYAVNVALVLVVLNPVRTPGVARTNRLALQVLRSLLLFGSTALNFLALRQLQLAETLSIQFATPLMVALLAGPVLGEWSSPRRLVAVAIGFLGVLVIVRPGVGAFQPAVLLSIGNMLCYAFYVLTTRKLASVDSTATTVFYSGLAGLALMSPLLPWIWTTPTAWSTWALLIGVGLFGTLGHWLLVLAHARAPANVLAPFIYTQLLWSLMLGYLIFGDVPNRWTLIGASIVIGSGLYLLAQESKALESRGRRRPDGACAPRDPASPQR
ncbi:multidrug transporter [Methylobacterium sp. Leaf111]|nr:multidrug transporter [Methylobacterium sp. Leaf111]KQU21030.1 multidrug transporter [Methylobacterium sp. Leaf94]